MYHTVLFYLQKIKFNFKRYYLNYDIFIDWSLLVSGIITMNKIAVMSLLVLIVYIFH